MKFFKRHIAPKIILNIFLGFAIFGMLFIFLTVNRMNHLLNTDLGFNKDSVVAIRTQDSKVILPDILVFSSDLPGFPVKNSIKITTENRKESVKMARQFISDTYFDMFNYKKLNENRNLFSDYRNVQLIYINESAVKELGINHIDDAVGTRLLDENNHELFICGVVEDYGNLCLNPSRQAKIYQINSEHLAYAFYDKTLLNEKESNSITALGTITFQERIQNRYKIIEDAVYSVFFFINLIIILIGIGFIGNKYTAKRERELFKILGIGIHILTLVISKTYIYLIAILGFVVGPLALLIQKFWLGIFDYRINFGLADIFIILSISFLTAYLVCCPKKKIEKQIKGDAIHVI
jgi:hypothetical protein